MSAQAMPLPPWIARQQQSLLQQRGHAWLLQGPSGLGQFELGLALVRAWLCETRHADAQWALGACGTCPSCHAADVRTHADLRVLMPETELIERGWPLSEKAQEEIDGKKRKPSREIRVEAMRELIEFSQRTSGRGLGKAVLVYPAERMNHVTANALLKTLEEPPGAVRFVLATEAAHELLPTIRSRCQLHTLAWPDATEALAWLVQQGVASDQAPALLQAAGGRPERALALVQTEGSAKAWAGLPRALAQGQGLAQLTTLPMPEAVSRLQKLCHDLLLLQMGAEPRYFARVDLPTRALSVAVLSRWWQQLGQSARSAEHPLNTGLALEFLADTARKVLNSKA